MMLKSASFDITANDDDKPVYLKRIEAITYS